MVQDGTVGRGGVESAPAALPVPDTQPDLCHCGTTVVKTTTPPLPLAHHPTAAVRNWQAGGTEILRRWYQWHWVCESLQGRGIAV